MADIATADSTLENGDEESKQILYCFDVQESRRGRFAEYLKHIVDSASSWGFVVSKVDNSETLTKAGGEEIKNPHGTLALITFTKISSLCKNQ